MRRDFGSAETVFRTDDVEPEDAGVAVADGEPGDLERAGMLAHRAEQRPDTDPAARGGHSPFTFREPGLNSLNHRIE